MLTCCAGSASMPSEQIETARGARESARVKLAGIVIAAKERITRTGSRMAWVRISDAAGSFEMTVFSEVLARVARGAGDGLECVS